MTKLEKDLTRESLKSVNDKPIIVTLTKEQEIALKLKGRGSETYKVSIGDLYKTLSGSESNSDVMVVDRGMIKALDELSTHSLIAEADYKVKVEIQRIIKEIKSWNK
jgi:hypothetical protein